MDYEFDRYTNDAVHTKLATITDDELLGIRCTGNCCGSGFV